MTVTLLTLTAVVAAGDWLAVWRRLFRVEFVLKPLTLALLVGAAATAHLGPAKWWIVAGLAFGLCGDIGLMLSADDAGSPDAPFILGLTAFLVGHICYLVGFARHGVHALYLLAGALIVIGAATLTLPQVLRGARAQGGIELRAVVGGYTGVLAAMTTLAVGTSAIATAAGGVLFLVSDTVIGIERFVSRSRGGPLVVIVTYHLAQLLIVIGLVRHL